MGRRSKHSADFKAKVAKEAIEGRLTLAELSQKYEVHQNMISRWKQEALDGLAEIFSHRKTKEEKDAEVEKDELYKQIGQLKVEVDWLKKKSALFRK